MAICPEEVVICTRDGKSYSSETPPGVSCRARDIVDMTSYIVCITRGEDQNVRHSDVHGTAYLDKLGVVHCEGPPGYSEIPTLPVGIEAMSYYDGLFVCSVGTSLKTFDFFYKGRGCERKTVQPVKGIIGSVSWSDRNIYFGSLTYWHRVKILKAMLISGVIYFLEYNGTLVRLSSLDRRWKPVEMMSGVSTFTGFDGRLLIVGKDGDMWEHGKKGRIICSGVTLVC